MEQNKYLILIPFAYLSEYKGGINLKRQDSNIGTYFKNCCVACISAKKNSGKETDVALCSNIKVPEPYATILADAQVKIINCPFDHFNFGSKVIWSLAFYKLNAMWHICRETQYVAYCYLDSDTYIQGSFSYIWKECHNSILLYDFCHGLQNKDYITMLKEVENLTGTSAIGITHYGGEFFAANRIHTISFMNECEKVYEKMLENHVSTTRGDEYIISVAASRTPLHIRNAGAYICRYWTRRWHLMSTNYKYSPVTVLHVPQEKEYGMLTIYKQYVSKGKMPNCRKVWSLLHLTRPSLRVSCVILLENVKNWIKCSLK